MSTPIAHARRYRVIYALGLAWALTITITPTRSPPPNPGDDIGSEQASSPLELDPSVRPSEPALSVAHTLGPRAPTSGDGAIIPSSTPTGIALHGTGVTRGGVECRPGVRQIPYSDYAAPCVSRFTGDNGGATFRGVTRDTIRIAVRRTADQRALDAGQAVEEWAEEYRRFVEYFNDTFELYGRKVVLETVQGRGSGIDELQGKDPARLACVDAGDIVDRGYFAALAYPGGPVTSPFAECAARRNLFIPHGPVYHPERDYARWHPYVWTLSMECERLARDVAEYVGKRLGGRLARWAGDPAYRERERAFGLYVPDNDSYQVCANILERELRDRYGIGLARRIDYTLDAGALAPQAVGASVQFKDAGVTTIILACDQTSTRLMTEAAQSQGWHPEWMIIGVDFQDTEFFARDWNQEQIHGHAFGLSQLGDGGRRGDPAGEFARASKAAGIRNWVPSPFYFYALDLFNKLQAAGPNLTPHTIAAGLRAMPPGGGKHAVYGTWSYREDHGAVVDAREVSWHRYAIAADGRPGLWVPTYRGRRFSSGQWPAEEPPIYRNPRP